MTQGLSKRDSWWRGKRGEWYVVVQFALMLLLFLGPGSAWWAPARLMRMGPAALIGKILLLGGLFLGVSAALWLGRSLTPLPHPKGEGILVERGPYRMVRHPIYTGVILIAYGWSIASASWLTAGYATLIFFWLDVKSRREERWLVEKYPGYRDYRKRVRHQLIPFLY